MNQVNIDHIIYGTPDLNEGIAIIHEKLGVKPVPGGSHPGFGTKNALLSLGGNTYLEILAPDPDQQNDYPSWMGIDDLSEPKLIGWAATSQEPLEEIISIATQNKIPTGDLIEMRRKSHQNGVIQWRMTSPDFSHGDGLIPFWLDWGETQHPSLSLPFGGELISMKGGHPHAIKVKQQLETLGFDLNVFLSPNPFLSANILTPSGIVVLH
ncbi:MAG: VOC family protein [Cyclobacteriaceae bacterium]